MPKKKKKARKAKGHRSGRKSNQSTSAGGSLLADHTSGSRTSRAAEETNVVTSAEIASDNDSKEGSTLACRGPVAEEFIRFVPILTPVANADEHLVNVGMRYWQMYGFDLADQPEWASPTREIDTAGYGRRVYIVAAAGVRAELPSFTCGTCSRSLTLRTRSDLSKLIAGAEVICLDCDGEILQLVEHLKDPVFRKRHATAMARANEVRSYEAANSVWRQMQAEILAATYPVTFSAGESPPAATVRGELVTLSLLRYSPSSNPLTPTASWPEPLHPDPGREASLLAEALHGGLLNIHPATEVGAFVWKPTSFEHALKDAQGNLDAIASPTLSGHFYPHLAKFYTSFGANIDDAVQKLDAHLITRLDTSDMSATRSKELLDLLIDLIVGETVRYLSHRLETVNLPPVPDNHLPRLIESARRVALARPLGEMLNLAWRATQSAAVSAQTHPRAPRANMSTYAVNRFESLTQEATANPNWAIKAFSSMYTHELSAMTRTLFHTVLNRQPFQTSLPDVQNMLEDEPSRDANIPAPRQSQENQRIDSQQA